MPVTEDVKLGGNGRIWFPSPANLYGCSIGDETKIGAFVEIQKKCLGGGSMQDIVAHVICEDVAVEEEIEAFDNRQLCCES